MEQYFLLNILYDTIDCVCNDYPMLMTVKKDKAVGLLWYHESNTESLWEMFDSTKRRDDYFKHIEQEFYIRFKKNLNTIYKLYPIEFNYQLCTSIILEW